MQPGRGRRVFASALACAALGSALAAGSAFAVAQPIVATDDVFSAATYTMDQGDRPVLQNNGVNQHNATARANGPDGKFLFESPTIGGGTTTLNGTQYLTAGTYAFICSIHPLSMQANLQVSAAGTPVARPQIDVLLGAGKLSKIAKKGKLPVTVKGITQSDGVTLQAKLGKSVIASQNAFNLTAGQSRKITLKLKKSAKGKLAKKKSAKLKVTGQVPFGAPDTGSRKYSG